MSEGLRPCGRDGCDQSPTATLVRANFPGTGRPFEFKECSLCGLGFVDPWPSQEEVSQLYTDSYAYYQGTAADAEAGGRSLKYSLARLRFKRLVRPTPGALLGELAARAAELLRWKTISYSLGIPLALPFTARILDYGCGSGLWLRAMNERGYEDLWGYDIGANKACRARLAEYGINWLSDEALHSERPCSFDLIRLEHVFEHLVDPRSVLGRIRRLLRSEGWLVMTYPSMHPWSRIPDLQSSPNREHLQLPMHLAHHTMESSRTNLESSGFSVVGCRLTRRENFLTIAARPS